MKKYMVPALLDKNIVKFVVTVPNDINTYQIKLLLMGKYKDHDIIVLTEGIVPIIEENFI